VLISLAVFSSPDEARFAAAYVGGTLGTLIGVDILNLRAISRLGTAIGSIGSAGTFDGVFLPVLLPCSLPEECAKRNQEQGSYGHASDNA
jgi:uncharacterized membrane protein